MVVLDDTTLRYRNSDMVLPEHRNSENWVAVRQERGAKHYVLKTGKIARKIGSHKKVAPVGRRSAPNGDTRSAPKK